MKMKFNATIGWCISILLWLCGIAGLLSLPFAAQKVKLDENGLLPLSSFPSNYRTSVPLKDLNYSDIHQVEDFLLDGNDFETYKHLFNTTFASEEAQICTVLTSVVHAPDNPQHDALLLISNLSMFPKLVQLMRMLGEAQWLAKNVIFVFTEDRCDSEDIIDQWLYQYHTGLDTYVDIQSGNIISALVLGYISDYEKSFQMSTNAGDGLLPNLDLVTMFRTIAFNARGGGFGVYYRGMDTYGEGRKCTPENVDDYYKQIMSLMAFYRNHFANQEGQKQKPFRRYAIDAIHISSLAEKRRRKVPPILQSTYKNWSEAKSRYDFLSVLELFIRSLNNLEEKLHHSEYLYLLLSSECYVPVVFIVPTVILLASVALIPLITVWASTADTEKKIEDVESLVFNSYRGLTQSFQNMLQLCILCTIFAMLTSVLASVFLAWGKRVDFASALSMMVALVIMILLFSTVLAHGLEGARSTGFGILLVSVSLIPYVATLFQGFGIVSFLLIALFPFYVIVNSEKLKGPIFCICLAHTWLASVVALLFWKEDLETVVTQLLHIKAGSKSWWFLFGVITPTLVGATGQTFAVARDNLARAKQVKRD